MRTCGVGGAQAGQVVRVLHTIQYSIAQSGNGGEQPIQIRSAQIVGGEIRQYIWWRAPSLRLSRKDRG
jgi:hypothetical protein